MTISDPIIALIDDNPSRLRSLGRLLSLRGFRVSLYSSAEEFLAEPLARAVAVALIDINLGAGMSGLELARGMRESAQNIPIILMSADARSIICAQAQQMIGVTVLEKPISIEALCEIIKISLLG